MPGSWIPTDETLYQIRQSAPSVRFLPCTPKGSLTKMEKDLASGNWQQVKYDVHFKLLLRDGELYVLARMLPRHSEESVMRRKKLKAYWVGLNEPKTATISPATPYCSPSAQPRKEPSATHAACNSSSSRCHEGQNLLHSSPIAEGPAKVLSY